MSTNVLHPLNTEEDKELLKGKLSGRKNADHLYASSANLYEMISHADIHIVASSAVAYEGLSYGTQTIIIHEQGADLFRDLIRSQVFAFADTSEKILHTIENFKPSIAGDEYKIVTSDENSLTFIQTFLHNSNSVHLTQALK